MKSYYIFSNTLVFLAIIFFISSFSIKSSGRSYVAAGSPGFVPLAFVLLTIVCIHAATVGYFYLRSNPDQCVKYLSILVGLLPMLILMVPLVIHWGEIFQEQRMLDYAVKVDDSKLIRKILEREVFETDLHEYTLKSALQSGLSNESLDLLNIQFNKTGFIFYKDRYSSPEDFRKVCLEGLIDANREEWIYYLELFNSQSGTNKYDSIVLSHAFSNPRQKVFDYFLNNISKRQWFVDRAINARSYKTLKYLNEKNIPIIHSKISDLLKDAVENSRPFHDAEYLKFIIGDLYNYDIPNDDKNRKLLLRIKDTGVLRWMIKQGANVFQHDTEGNSFLHKLYLLSEHGSIGYKFRDVYSQYVSNDLLSIPNSSGTTIHMVMAQKDHEIRNVVDDINVGIFDKDKNHLFHYLFRKTEYLREGTSDEHLLKSIVGRYKANKLDINMRNAFGVHPLQSVYFTALKEENYEKSGFVFDVLNPITGEFVMVDAFNDYIDFITNDQRKTYYYKNGNENLYQNFPDLAVAFKRLNSEDEKEISLKKILDFYTKKSQMIGGDHFVEKVVDLINKAYSNSL